MARNGLEQRLEEITREFVRQIVDAIRGASFGEVAQLELPRAAAPRAPRAASRPVTRVTASPRAESNGAGKVRQTAGRRAELGERVLRALEGRDPMSARALSSELGVAADLLTAPLLELRAAGKIAKHGEKRATTYTLA